MTEDGTTALVVAATAVDTLIAETGQRPAIPTPQERSRAERLARAADRACYFAGGQAVRLAASAALGTPVSELVYRQLCASCGGSDHGRPWVESLSGARIGASVSRSGGVVAALAGEGSSIDVESIGLCVDPLPGFFSRADEEAVRSSADAAEARARLWTVREALVKLGAGSLDDIGGWEVASALDRDGALLRVGGADYRSWRVTAPAGFVATVVTPGTRDRVVASPDFVARS